ncbi:hypothetical protein [Parasphingorhabdus sp.]|uniref:hypothetical protein n=1 Tax=Parasphingorhabdus sp. TaxID=2709688 RepID=UPI003A90F7AC
MKRSHLRGLYRSDFRTFISFAFRELYPEKVFVDGWYLDIVCDELMRCGPNGNHRLILNLPPRYLKSFCASIAWPLFMAARHSGMRICVIAGTRELASEFREMRKRLLRSPRLLAVFPELRFRDEGDTLIFANRAQISQSYISKSQIGRSADIYVIDDPLPARHAHSEKKRNVINNWYDDEIVARLSRKDKAVLVLVMQRLHSDDLCGHLDRNKEAWRRTALSAIDNKDEQWQLSDGRTIERAAGEVLCSLIETKDQLREILIEMKGRNFRAQYLQRPASGLFDRESRFLMHFQRVTENWKFGEPKLLHRGGCFIITSEQDIIWDYFGVPNPFKEGRKLTEEEWEREFYIQQTELIASVFKDRDERERREKAAKRPPND